MFNLPNVRPVFPIFLCGLPRFHSPARSPGRDRRLECFQARRGFVTSLIIPHRGRLPFGDSFRTLRHKENLHRSKNDLQVLGYTGVSDVHEIHEELVPGCGIIFSIDLRITGEAGLGLEAQSELGEFLFILSSNLRAFRAGTDDAHLPLEDVDQLGEFVDADRADEVADRGDAVIVFAGRETGDTVFFRIHAHAAEFEDVEFSAVLGQALLAVEGGSSVAADQKGDDDHEGRENDQGDPGADNVKETLNDQVFRGRVIAFQHQHGQVEHMHGVGALHEEVADPRDHVDADAARDALFYDLVSLMAVDAAEEDGTGLREISIGIPEDIPDIGRVDNVESLVQSIGFNQFLQTFTHVPDNQSRNRLISGEIQAMCGPAPDDGQDPACDHGG